MYACTGIDTLSHLILHFCIFLIGQCAVTCDLMCPVFPPTLPLPLPPVESILAEQALMSDLFAPLKYNLKVRPARRAEERVVVRVGMMLTSFVGLVRVCHKHPHVLNRHTHILNTHTHTY